MSWEMGVALGLIIILLYDISRQIGGIGSALNGLGDKLKEQVKLADVQSQNLIEINRNLARLESGYSPPTVHFCDLCRKKYPESNRWWTTHKHGFLPLRLCAYPQQKERPEDKWLHGEECVLAELRAYMAIVEHQWRGNKRQKREYTEYGDSKITRTIDASHCGQCDKEYSESDFWWSVSADRMVMEVSEGFKSCAYYFCSKECVLAVVELFIAAQTNETLPEWDEYLAAVGRSNLRARLEAYAAAKASPPVQAVPAAASHQESVHISIPRAIGRVIGSFLRR